VHILVLLKMVPDVVEDLEIAPDGKALDLEYLRMILSESDDHALEQALLMKERHGGKVTVLALDAPEVDDALFTAMAKGADRVVKVVGMEAGATTRQAARVFAQVIRSGAGFMPADLVLTGVQAIDDLDGLIAPLVAHELGLPYLGIVMRVGFDAPGQLVQAIKEYAGGGKTAALCSRGQGAHGHEIAEDRLHFGATPRGWGLAGDRGGGDEEERAGRARRNAGRRSR